MVTGAPGVRIFYSQNGPAVISAVSTSVTAFIGATRSGGSVLGGTIQRPVKVTSTKEYRELFALDGVAIGSVSMPTAGANASDPMGMAVKGFFENGGREAYILSTNTANT